MGERTSYEPGTFSWVDLATPDPAGAKAFYSELFGWEPNDMPAGEGVTYTMFTLGGHYVAALAEQPEQERSQGVPPHWNSYITVADADETAAKAGSLGGSVLAAPFDVLDDVGRMAVIGDREGAVFCIWQPRQNIGAGLVNDVGCLCWNELSSRDPEAAIGFYTALFGWDTETLDTGQGFSYTMLRIDGRSNGGIRELTAGESGIPPHWLPYFTVESSDEAASRVESLGGRVLAGPMDVPMGRIAALADPQGAAFAFFQGETDP